MATKDKELTRLMETAAIPGRRAESVIRILEGDRTLGARLFAPNYREHKAWQKPGAKKAFRAKMAFPDLKVTVEDTIESGDRVVVRWRAQGTHNGKVGKIKATASKVDFTGITIYRFAGGRIVESWAQADIATLASQCRIGPQIFEQIEAIRTAAPRVTRRPAAPRARRTTPSR